MKDKLIMRDFGIAGPSFDKCHHCQTDGALEVTSLERIGFGVDDDTSEGELEVSQTCKHCKGDSFFYHVGPEHQLQAIETKADKIGVERT